MSMGALAEKFSETGGDRVIELNEHDERDAGVVVPNAEQGAKGIEPLGDQDSTADSAMYLRRCLILDELVMCCVGPAPEQHESGQKNVEPVKDERGTESDELGEQPRGQRHERDREEKAKVNPGEIARALAEMIELRLLSGPEDAEREKAHQVGDPLRAQRGESVAQRGFGMDGLG